VETGASRKTRRERRETSGANGFNRRIKPVPLIAKERKSVNPFAAFARRISAVRGIVPAKKKSPAAIFFRVANPVEALGFQFVQDRPLLPLFDGAGNCLGQQPDLFEQLDHGEINKLQQVHDDFLRPAGRRSCR
jgi:hypothetical protein